MARTTKSKKSEQSFEEKLAELEKLVGQLESGDLPLEKAVQTFEDGMKLSQQLNQVLQAAEKKIEVLMNKENGGTALKPFDPPLDEDEE